MDGRIGNALIFVGIVVTFVGLLIAVNRRRRHALAWSDSANIVWHAAGVLAFREGAATVGVGHVLRVALACPPVAEAVRQGGGDPDALRRSLEDFDGMAAVGGEAGEPEPESGFYRPPRNAFVPATPFTPRLTRISREVGHRARDARRFEMTLGGLLRGCALEPELRDHLGGARFDDDIDVDDDVAREGCIYVWNDDATTMESVVSLLRDEIGLSDHVATLRMLTVHHRGYAAVGPFSPERVQSLLDSARKHTPTLRLTREPPDTSDWMANDNGLLPPTARGRGSA